MKERIAAEEEIQKITLYTMGALAFINIPTGLLVFAIVIYVDNEEEIDEWAHDKWDDVTDVFPGTPPPLRPRNGGTIDNCCTMGCHGETDPFVDRPPGPPSPPPVFPPSSPPPDIPPGLWD